MFLQSDLIIEENIMDKLEKLTIKQKVLPQNKGENN